MRLALPAFLLALLLSGAALARPALSREPHFDSLGDLGAVSDSVITAIAQDGRGFLWVGGPGGLLRYDGYQMREFRLSEDGQGSAAIVRSILAARDGHVWVAGDGIDLVRLDPASGAVRRFRPDAARAEALSPGSVRALAEDRDGQIWVATLGGGLHRYDPQSERFRRFRQADGALPDDRVQSLHLDRQGRLWVGTWNGLARCEPRAQRCAAVHAEAETGLAGQTISMLGEADDAQVWAGTLDGSLYAIDSAADHGRWLERKGLGAVHAMQRLADGSVWVARTSGIEHRDAADGRLLRRLQHDVRKPWSLRHNDVASLLRDRSGWLWVGSYGGGLQRHNPAEAGLWVRRAEGQGALAAADVRSLLALPGGELWLGTAEAGVAVLDAQLRLIGEIRPGSSTMAAGTVGAMVRDAAGDIWLASDGQLNRFDAQRRRLDQWQVSQGRIRRLLAARDGRLWIATQDGLYRLDDRRSRPQRVALTTDQGLFGNINALAEDAAGRVWVGGDAGLFLVPPGGRRLQALPAHPREALPALPVVGLLVDREDRLWVDSNAGLFRLRDAAAAEPAFEAVGLALGLGPREFGANLLEDEQGRLWTQRGMLDPRAGRRYALTAADGADIGTGWFRSYTALPDGRLLFGGSTGLLVVEPSRFLPWADQPPLAITELRLGGRPAPVPRHELVLPPGQRSLALEFAALDFSAPMRNRYRYRLEGLDEDWTEVSAAARVLSYSHLPPGDYRLRVQGSNRVGVWSPHELSLPLRVEPAWWQSRWAQAGALLALLGAVAALVQGRTRQLRQRQAVLEARVRERTLELEEASLTDPLTGLRNRRYLNQHIGADVALTVRQHEQALSGAAAAPPTDLVFFLVDMDHFKRINDDHGHAAGDAVIQQMQQRLRQVFRDGDHLVRWGGEEFLVVARGTDRHQAPLLAERMRQQVSAQAFEIGDGRRIFCSCSIGFACFPPLPPQPRLLDWHQCLRLADLALYDAKQRGRDAWTGVMRVEQLPLLPPAEWLRADGVKLQRSV